MKEFIEIPFGAKDSELYGWEYTIPEGFVASIENGKIIVKKEESEDEKIRKELIEYFKHYSGDDNVSIKFPEWIAWLEKQGEQKVSVVDFKAKDWYVSKVDGKIYNAKFMEKTPNNQARRLEIEKAAISATGIIEREEWFIKGAEWADEHPKEGMVSIDKACDFIKVNAYKYGKIKISMHGLPSFDFRTDTFIKDLKQMLEE